MSRTGRPKLPPGDKRGERVHACFTVGEVAAIDAVRGPLTRGQWLLATARLALGTWTVTIAHYPDGGGFLDAISHPGPLASP